MIDVRHPLLQSVCQVHVGAEPLGTGWMLDQRHVITAAHVIKGRLTEECTALPIELLFSDGALRLRADIRMVNWPYDIAVLVLDFPEGLTPPAPVPVAKLDDLSTNAPIHWEAYGFPQRVNASGFALSGTITGKRIPLRNGAHVLQLTLQQHEAAALGGASGGPIFADGRCIGIIGGYPLGLKVGTIFATALQDIPDIEPVRIALERAAHVLPEDLQLLLEGQLAWADNFRALVLPSARGHRPQFVNRTLVAEDGQSLHLAQLGMALGQPGNLIEGEVGLGKSRLLAEVVKRCTSTPIDIGFAEHTIPLLLRASDLSTVGEFFGVMATQSLYPQPFVDAARLRILLTRPGPRWVFLIDALDEAVGSDGAQARLEQYMASLDLFCRQHRHHWIATRRSNTSPIRLPVGTRLFHLRGLSMAEAKALASAVAADSPVDHLPDVITRNPLLLNAAAQLASTPRALNFSSPTWVLLSFLQEILREAQEVSLLRDRELREAFRALPLIDVASLIATATDDPDDVAEALQAALAQKSGLGMLSARRVALRLLEVVLPSTGLINLSGNKLMWTHTLYREVLLAYQLAEEWSAAGALEEQILQNKISAARNSAAGLALVLLQKKVDVVHVLDGIAFDRCPQILTDYIVFGGTLSPDLLAGHLAFLCDSVEAHKHHQRTCATLMSQAFSPFDCLLSLRYLPEARQILHAAADDLFADPGLRSEIRARLGDNQQQEPKQ